MTAFNPGPASQVTNNLSALLGVKLTAAQVAAPTPDILSDTTRVYQGPGGTLYQSTGSALIAFSAQTSAGVALSLTDTGAANLATLNAALALGGLVQIAAAPGRYTVSGTLLLPSNTELNIPKGVEIFLANNACVPLVMNKNAFAAGFALTGVSVLWTGNNPSYSGQINFAGIDTLYPVGSWFAIGGLTTSANDRTFLGVWQVTTTAANQINFNMSSQPAGGGNSSTGAIIYPADSYIKVSGGGILNPNGANQTAQGYVAGDPRTVGIWFRNTKSAAVTQVHIKRANSWTIGSSNGHDLDITDIDGDTFIVGGTVTSTDTVHLAGGHRRVLIQNIRGGCSDNIVGLTIDVGGATSSYSTLYSPGDMWDVVIKDIYGVETTTAAIVGIWGNTGYLHHSIQIDGVHGKAAGAGVTMYPYAPTNMLNCCGGTLSISNVSADCGGPPVVCSGDGTWDLISVDTVRSDTAASPLLPFVSVASTTTAQIIRHLAINRVIAPTTVQRTIEAITIKDSTIDYVDISLMQDVQTTAGINAVNVTGTLGAGIKKISMRAASAFTTATGAGALIGFTNTYQVGKVELINSEFTGTTQTGWMVNVGASALVTEVAIYGARVSAVAGVINNANTTATFYCAWSDVELTTLCANAAVYAGPTNMDCVNYRELVAPTNNPFKALTTAKAYDFRFRNTRSLKTDLIQFTAGANLRLRGAEDAFTAGANVTAPQPSDMFYAIDTGTSGSASIGMKGRTNAGAWTAVF